MKRISWIVIFVQCSFAIDASAQTLAEAARRERERQRTVQSQSRGAVFKNTTAGAVGGTAVTSSSTSSNTAVAPAVPVVKPPTDSKGRDEKYWRGQFQQARDAVKRADERIQLLDAKLKDLNTQLLNRNDIYNKESVIGAQITDTQKQLDDARKESDQAKQKIADLEEDLRRSGGLPGWAR